MMVRFIDRLFCLLLGHTWGPLPGIKLTHGRKCVHCGVAVDRVQYKKLHHRRLARVWGSAGAYEEMRGRDYPNVPPKRFWSV